MFKVLVAALVFATCMADSFAAKVKTQKVQVGDSIVVKLMDDVAEGYVKLGAGKVLKGQGLTVSVIATVAEVHDNDRVRVETTSTFRSQGKADRLVTLAATFEARQVQLRTTPKGTKVYASPAETQDPAKGIETTEDSQQLEVSLSDLKGVKIRARTLTEEIGE
jgi:hypothetical protein